MNHIDHFKNFMVVSDSICFYNGASLLHTGYWFLLDTELVIDENNKHDLPDFLIKKFIKGKKNLKRIVKYEQGVEVLFDVP